MRILIVEDEAILAMDIMTHLLQWGYEVAGLFSSGEEAVDWLQDKQADLILMDITLSGPMNGIETATLININSQIPVVFLTAHNDNDMIKRGKDAGGFGFLSKPYDATTLKSTIEMAYGRFLDMVEIRRLNAELKNSLDKIELLRQHIPICAWCKQIKSKDGSWQHIDKYLMANSPIEFSHGICPICKKEVFDAKK